MYARDSGSELSPHFWRAPNGTTARAHNIMTEEEINVQRISIWTCHLTEFFILKLSV